MPQLDPVPMIDPPPPPPPPQGGSQASSSSSGSSSDSDSSSSESLRFDDGLDDELVGDEEDRKKLSLMTDVEREQEMYNR